MEVEVEVVVAAEVEVVAAEVVVVVAACVEGQVPLTTQPRTTSPTFALITCFDEFLLRRVGVDGIRHTAHVLRVPHLRVTDGCCMESGAWFLVSTRTSV